MIDHPHVTAIDTELHCHVGRSWPADEATEKRLIDAALGVGYTMGQRSARESLDTNPDPIIPIRKSDLDSLYIAYRIARALASHYEDDDHEEVRDRLAAAIACIEQGGA